jgi:hypothetical protein
MDVSAALTHSIVRAPIRTGRDIATAPEPRIIDFGVPYLSFLQTSLVMVCLTGRIRTVLHDDRISLVLEEKGGLRHILSSADWLTMEGWNDFWIPRRDADRKRFNEERRAAKRNRLNETIRRIMPEERPARDAVPIEDAFPSDFNFQEMKRLCLDFECPWHALPHLSHPGYGYKRPSRAKQPPLPSLVEPLSHGYSAEQVVKIISRHNWDDARAGGVFAVVFEERKPQEVAVERGLLVERLSQYAWIVRSELRKNHAAS